MKHTLPLLLLLFCGLYNSAQVAGQQRYCYTDELWAEKVSHDSSLLFARRQMDAVISKLSNQAILNSPTNNHTEGPQTNIPATVIPTVIYIVYDSSYVNISMAQIQSQMDQLNANYAAYGYQFCYAKRNVTDTAHFVPQAGDSAGVFRIQSSLSNVTAYSSTDAQLKALSTLPSPNYLRIFVVHNINPEGILGYTQFPDGGPAATDGIVIRYDVFGSNNYCNSCTFYPEYNLGAALTHECGHFLDLYHTFQGGCDTGVAGGTNNCGLTGDLICDTPPTDGSFGCPHPAPLSCDGIDTEFVQNYMDYTDDPCKNSFTPGQKARMDLGVSAYRALLVSPQNLINTGISCVNLGNTYADFNTSNFNSCVGAPMVFGSLSSSGFTYNWDFGDGNTATGDTVTHTYSQAGEFAVQLQATNTGAGISATSSTPVFVTACSPLQCSANKLSFNFGYLDFETGNAIAVSHAQADAGNSNSEFYNVFSRGDGQGNKLFNIGQGANYMMELEDSLFNVVDTLGHSPASAGILVPVPGHSTQYCYLYYPLYYDATYGQYDIAGTVMLYDIIETAGGAHVVPNKRNIPLPVSGSANWTYNLAVTAIPNCTGSKMWIINQLNSNLLNVFYLDSSSTVYYQNSFTPTYPAAQPVGLRASPDGSKICTTKELDNGNQVGTAIYDFNKSSGTITAENFLAVGDQGYNSPAFSPGGRFLYVADYGYPVYLYQYDLQNPDPVGSRKLLSALPYGAGSPEGFIVTIYDGPDKKVYVGYCVNSSGIGPSFRMSVIDYPDNLENGLNSTWFNINGPEVRPIGANYITYNSEGFTTIVDFCDAFGCNWQADVPNPFSYRADSCFNYRFYGDECWPSLWNFGDAASGTADTSTLSLPVHNFTAQGSYMVKQVINGLTFVDTINVSGPPAGIAATPFVSCQSPFANYSVASIQPFINYIWTLTNGTPATDGGQNNINVLWNQGSNTGTVTLTAIDTVTGCSSSAMLAVNIPQNGVYHINLADSICNGATYQFNKMQIKTAGVYTDSIASSTGCDSVVTLHLTVNPLPNVTWIGANDTFNITTGSIALSGGSPSGGTYSGVGVSGTAFYPDSASNGSYTISYTYTDSQGCTGSASRIFVVSGINGQTVENRILLYPDPASNTVTLKSDLFASSNIQILLYDIAGRVTDAPLEKYPDKAICNISNLASGQYWFKLNINGQVVIKRFVKM